MLSNERKAVLIISMMHNISFANFAGNYRLFCDYAFNEERENFNVIIASLTEKFMPTREEVFIVMEPFYKTYKPAWKSFYKLLFLALLLLILAGIGSVWGPLTEGAKKTWMWIAVIVIDVLILFYVVVKRWTMSLVLRDNPDKAEDQEVAFIECDPLKPFSSDFRKSIEIGLANIIHIKVGQTMMQTILNIGDVIITSSGTGAEEIFAHNIPDPNAVRDEIQIHARKYTMPAGSASSSSSEATPGI